MHALVAIPGIPSHLGALLILRATNLCKQGVTGSIPVTSTNFSFMLIALDVLLDCVRIRLAGTGTLQ